MWHPPMKREIAGESEDCLCFKNVLDAVFNVERETDRSGVVTPGWWAGFRICGRSRNTTGGCMA